MLQITMKKHCDFGVCLGFAGILRFLEAAYLFCFLNHRFTLSHIGGINATIRLLYYGFDVQHLIHHRVAVYLGGFDFDHAAELLEDQFGEYAFSLFPLLLGLDVRPRFGDGDH